MTLRFAGFGWSTVLAEGLGAKLVGLLGFAATQTAVQCIGFAVGLLLVHSLAVDAYAYYALATSMVGITTVMLDLGLGNALLARAGPLLGRPAALAAVFADALALQRRLALWLMPLLVAGFAAMFLHHQASAGQAALLTTLVAACGLIQVRSSLSLAMLRLHGERRLQQRLDLATQFAKAAAIATLALIALTAPLALAANAVAATLTWACLHHWMRRRLPPLPVADGRFRAPLLDLVRRQAPNSLYYCLSGQITLWLVGLLGSTRSMADVGALGRIALVFTIVGTVVSAIVQPYFARHDDARRLVPAFVAVNLFFVATTALLWLVGTLFPAEVLWILGGAYRDLQDAVPWVMLASSLSAWSAAVYAIGSARGWLVPGPWVIGSGVVGIAACVHWLDVSTPRGAFVMNAATAAIATVLTLAYVTHQLGRHVRGPEETPR